MKVFIGIDGGGSRTVSLTTDENFTVLTNSTLGASNLTINGIDNAVILIQEIVAKSFSIVDASKVSMISILAGLAGAGRKEDCEKLKNILSQKLHNEYQKEFCISIVSDAVIALEGALSGRPGAVLITGTGSILFGKDKHNIFFRVGGFGRILGDEGSGYSIGSKALRQFTHFLDGRKAKTKLDEIISQALEIYDSNIIIKKVYSGEIDIASLAPIVIDAAEEGCDDAKIIMEEESDELLNHLPPFIKSAGSTSPELSFIGSLISNENFYSRLIENKIKKQFPQVKIITAEHSPAYGAVLLAKKLCESGSK